MRKFLIIIAIIGCILGYGYWHSYTHALFHIQLNLKDDAGKRPEVIPNAEIIFFDSAGRLLANGISDGQYNYVHLIHPEVGDCQDVDKSASFSKEPKNPGRSVLSIC